MAPNNFRWRSETAKNALHGKHIAEVDHVMTIGASERQIIKLWRLDGAARVDV